MDGGTVVVTVALGIVVAGAGLASVLPYLRSTVLARRIRRARRTPVVEAREGDLVKVVGVLRLVEGPLEAPVTGRACAHYRATLVGHGRSGEYLLADESERCATIRVDDEGGGVAFVRLDEQSELLVDYDTEFKKTIATPEPPVEIERFLARHGNPNEGMGVTLREAALEPGRRVAVVARARWEPWNDPDAVGGGYRSPGRCLMLAAEGGEPVRLTDDESTFR